MQRRLFKHGTRAHRRGAVPRKGKAACPERGFALMERVV
ncbi:hypothetical protein NMD1_01249 [Novosphingobium sp. MD-1]|nr:hypothetical protein NMD1_01249 [Novosphingobium sp. MD-1]